MPIPARLTVALIAFVALAAGALAAWSSPAGAQQTVAVGDVYFCSPSFTNGICETTVTAGETVTWDFGGASLPHTTTDCGGDCDNPTGSPLWDSGTLSSGTFSFTFSTPGTYLYRCDVHPDQMRGRIVVQAAPDQPTEEPTDGAPEDGDGAPVATTPPTAGDVGGTPKVGSGPSSSPGTAWWIAAATAGLAAFGAGASAYGLLRRRPDES